MKEFDYGIRTACLHNVPPASGCSVLCRTCMKTSVIFPFNSSQDLANGALEELGFYIL